VSDGKLNCTLIQRSGDVCAAAASGGFDTIEYALLIHMVAQVCNLKPGIFNHYVNNLHIYDRHVDIVKEALNNPEYDAPRLWINPEVKNLEDFTVDDFKLLDYQSTKYEGKIPVAV
jgi:thymidylate synthase